MEQKFVPLKKVLVKILRREEVFGSGWAFECSGDAMDHRDDSH